MIAYSSLFFFIIFCTAKGEESQDFGNTVVIQGVKFATILDNDVHPTDHTLGCQDGKKTLFLNDSKWRIAKHDDPIHRKAVGSLPWGTSCLGMEGGVSLGTKTLNICKDKNAFTEVDNYSEIEYSVNDCDQRILFYYDSPTPINEASFFNSTTGFSKSDGASNCITVINNSSSLLVSCAQQSNDVVFTKEILISSDFSVSLQAGFIFKISSACPNCTLDFETKKYSVVVTLKHDKGSEDFTLSWEENEKVVEKSFVSIPAYHIQSISLSLNFTTLQGTSSFSSFSILPIDNLLENPSFNSNDFLVSNNWKRLADGYMPDIPRVDNNSSSPFGSILMSNSFVDETDLNLNAASQLINFDSSDQIRSFYIAGYSKASSVSGTMDDNYAIYCDFEYADGTHLYGQTVQFSTGTHDWEYRDTVIETTKPLKSLNVTLIFREHTGAVWFDDVVVQIAYSSPEDKNNNKDYVYNCTAGVFGDPFFSTFFNQRYSFQTPGDFNLLQSNNLNIQTRHQKIIGNVNGTLISAVGVQLVANSLSHIISFQFPNGSWDKNSPLDYKNSVTIYHNGEKVSIEEDGFVIPNFGVVTKSDYSYYVPIYNESSSRYSFESDPSGYFYQIKFAEGEVIVDAHFLLNEKTNIVFAGYFRVFIHLSTSYCQSVDGLLGTTNAINFPQSTEKIDLLNATQDEINKLGNSWRLDTKRNEIFFTPPEVQMYQPDFPPYAFSFNYTSEIEINNAKTMCERQSLTSLNEICVGDVLLCGNQYIAQDYHSSERHLRIVLNPLQLSEDKIDTWHNNYVNLSKNYGTIVIGSIFVLLAIAGVITIFRCKKTKRKDSQQREMLINEE